MAAIRTVVGVGTLVGGVAATFVALMVMAGLVAAEDVPFWPTSEPECAAAPGFALRGGTATTVLATGGDLPVDAVNTALQERGHDVVVELAPREEQTDVRLLSAAPTAPAEVEGPLRTGGTIGASGATQLVLGPDTFSGAWVVRVGCAAA